MFCTHTCILLYKKQNMQFMFINVNIKLTQYRKYDWLQGPMSAFSCNVLYVCVSLAGCVLVKLQNFNDNDTFSALAWLADIVPEAFDQCGYMDVWFNQLFKRDVVARAYWSRGILADVFGCTFFCQKLYNRCDFFGWAKYVTWPAGW